MLEFVYRKGGKRLWVGRFGAALAIGLAVPTGPAHSEESGRVAPVANLIDAVESGFGGRILMIELAQAASVAGPAEYDVKLLTDEGNVLRLHYDARTLKLRAVEGRGGSARIEAEDEEEFEDEVEREDADEIELEKDRGDRSDDSSGPGSGDDRGGDDSSGSGSSGSGSSGSGSSGSGSGGSGSGGSGGGGSDDGPDHN